MSYGNRRYRAFNGTSRELTNVMCYPKLEGQCARAPPAAALLLACPGSDLIMRLPFRISLNGFPYLGDLRLWPVFFEIGGPVTACCSAVTTMPATLDARPGEINGSLGDVRVREFGE